VQRRGEKSFLGPGGSIFGGSIFVPLGGIWIDNSSCVWPPSGQASLIKTLESLCSNRSVFCRRICCVTPGTRTPARFLRKSPGRRDRHAAQAVGGLATLRPRVFYRIRPVATLAPSRTVLPPYHQTAMLELDHQTAMLELGACLVVRPRTGTPTGSG
jgi:ribosomal protein L34E